MQLTAAGYIVLPLCLMFLFRQTVLLQLALVASVFDAASVIIFHFGGEPFGLPGSLILGLVAVGILALDYRSLTLRQAEWLAARVTWPLVAFTILALAGAIILPRLFAGQFEVWPQNPGPASLPVALEPSGGNITQSLYLAANTVALVLVAFFACRPRIRPMAFVHAYLVGGYIAAGFVLWQVVSRQTGLYYPSDLLYSNPRWAILSTQAFGGIDRINGPFTEPAAVAGYFSGIAFACLRLYLARYRGFPVLPLLLLALISMLLSTSTTGLVIVAIVIATLLLRSTQRGALGFGVAGAVAGIFLIGIVTYLAAPSVFANVEEVSSAVLHEAVLNKPESNSYEDRTTRDIDSLGVLGPSYGFGAGWGSVRSSSLVPGILANSGIPGLVLLGWFAVRAGRFVRSARRRAPPGNTRAALDALSGAVLGGVCAALLAGPTINGIVFFLLLALMIGCAAHIHLDADERAATHDLPPAAKRATLPASPLLGMP